MDDTTKQLFTDFFTELLGFSPDLDISESEEQITLQLQLEPQHSGVLIGYQGETLNAIQLILSLVYQRAHDDWKPIRLNINDYRQKRQQSLEALAGNAAAKAVTEGVSVSLTGLTSYERRIVHAFLTDDPSVVTHSEGEDPHRYLIVSPKPKDQ